MTIDYAKLVTAAHLNVVKEALVTVACDPVFGKYCLYITIDTTDRNVIMPDWLRTQYSESITIVINNDFHNLRVIDTFFMVTLGFKGIQATLEIPFNSIRVFADTLNNFQLAFNVEKNETNPPAAPADDELEFVKNPETKNETKNETKVVSLDDFRNKTD